MPYNPAANPYTMNARELPSNPAAAAAVPLWNTIDPSTGSAYVSPANWASSPYFTPNWSVGGAQATSPVCTASVTWPDAMQADRSATKVPTLTGVRTASGNNPVHATATPITITGYGFTGATAVTVGGVACTAVTVVNDATITCTTAATGVLANAGTYPVVVTTPAGSGGGVSLTLT